MVRSTDPLSSREPGHSASLLARKVGRKIKEARLQSGLSRRALGAKLEISGQQIQKYEIGQDAVPLHRLLTLAAVCGVPPDTFWSQESAPDNSGIGAADISTLQLVRAYKRIADVKVRQRLLQLIKGLAGDDDAGDS